MKTSAARRGGFGRALLALWLLLFPLAAAVSAGVEKAPAGARAPALAPAAPAPRANAPAPGGVWGENRVRGSEPLFVQSRWGEILVIPDARRGCVWVWRRDASGRVNLYIFPGNDPVNKTDPFGRISPEEEAALLQEAMTYDEYAETEGYAVGGVRDALINLYVAEKKKDAQAAAGLDYSDDWEVVKILRAEVAAEKKKALYALAQSMAGKEPAGNRGRIAQDLLTDIKNAIDSGDTSTYNRRVWDLETFWAGGPEALRERRAGMGQMLLQAFRGHVAAFGSSLAARTIAQDLTQRWRLRYNNVPRFGNRARANSTIKGSRGALKPGPDLTPDQLAEHLTIDEITQHGDPAKWTFLGEKGGSRVPATSGGASPGTVKVYEVWRNAYGKEVEVHYFETPEGQAQDVKLAPRSP